MAEYDKTIDVRKATAEDDLQKISELLYETDPYIYPYWFGSLENCKKELPSYLVEDKFFFNVNHLYVGISNTTNEIVGVVCILDKTVDLDYDYSELKKVNERYCFTIVNYIEELIKEVKNSNFAYISNVCVDSDCRGQHIGNQMVSEIIEICKDKLLKEVVLDVLADNPAAIKLYQNLGFEQFTEIFEGFNNPRKVKPDVFSMKATIE